ncbi:MAG TPA: hypothetical protein VGH13_21735, partial [Xanthobacteraceae bacterium]
MKPKTVTGNLGALPGALRPLTDLRRWVLWRWVNKNNKWTKPPFQINDPKRNAANNDPATWGAHEKAVARVKEGAADGIGFNLFGGEIGAVDIDNCRDRDTGVIAEWANDLLARAPDAYAEITVSGTGLRIVGTTQHREKGFHRKFRVGDGPGSYEVYGAVARYITVSGFALDGRGDGPLPNIDALLEELIKEGDKDKNAAPPKGEEKAVSARADRKPLAKALETMLCIADRGAGTACGAYNSRSEALYAFIKLALVQGVDENDIVDAAVAPKYAGCGIYEHCAENGGEKYLRAQIQHALNDGLELKAKKDDRRIIRLKSGERHLAVKRTEDALVRMGRPIYVRGGILVEPLFRWEKSSEESRDTLVTQFLKLNKARLAYMAANWAVDYQRYNAKEKQWASIDPPNDVIETLLELGHWGFATVKGISNSPIMRRDGSLFDMPGYDDESQLWYKPGADIELPVITRRPTRQQALDALGTIRHLLSEFPFVDEGTEGSGPLSESVAIAGLMTPVLRGAFDHAPCFLFLAPESGTGKTYLVTTISTIATGRQPMAIAGCANREEMEKRLSATAFAAMPITSLNNLDFNLESALLNQMITESPVGIRLFGRNDQMIPCDCRGMTIFANGNNIAVVGDLVRRTLTAHIDSGKEDPERREFKLNPVKMVKVDRGKYLATVYTIVRAYIEAGEPDMDVKPLGGFEGWSRMVRNPLIWLGLPDPVDSMKDARANDPHRSGVRARHDALLDIWGTEQTFTAADIVGKTQEMGLGGGGMPTFRNAELRDSFAGPK